MKAPPRKITFKIRKSEEFVIYDTPKTREDFRKIPDTGGVYLLFDETDYLLYIGQTCELRVRLRTHFSMTNPLIKTPQKFVRFAYQLEDDIPSRLFLEKYYMQTYRPLYNTKGTWNKNEVFIVTDEEMQKVAQEKPIV